MEFEETVQMTSDWFKVFYGQGGSGMLEITRQQIEEYSDLAICRGLNWIN